MKCPNCKKNISDKVVSREAARIMGRRTSKAKASAARANGKLGGRPKIKKK